MVFPFCKYKLTNFLLIIFLLLSLSCSKTKTTFLPRTYHSTTSLFNGYYNANLIYKETLTQLEEDYNIPENELIEVVYYGTEDEIKSITAQFDKLIEKNDVVIYKHPNGNMVDDCRLLTGKAQFYKKEYEIAMENFDDILENHAASDLIPETQLWKAKTFYMMENPEMTRNILRTQIIENDTIELDKRVRGDLGLFLTKMAIDADSLSRAANVLSTHIEFVSNRRRKARSHFLLGQLYAETQKYPQALENYELVSKYTNNYDFLFRTKMKIARLYINFQEGQDDDNKVREYLAKLLKDEKNIDYRDQIYYEFGQLAIKKDSLNKAIDYFKQSISSSTNNQRQKALSYYATGQIYFNDYQDYPNAQAYYDSAAQSVTPDMREYKTISTLAKTLREYVTYLNTIHYQDSMLYLASLPEDKLNAIIDDLVEQEKLRKEKELAEEQARLAEQQQNSQQSSFLLNQAQRNQSRNRRSANSGGGTWYFDNPAAVSSGKLQFQQLWGQRKNEDNWRRKNKTQVGFVDNTTGQDAQTAVVDSALLEKYGDKYPYMKDIPQTEEAKVASAEMIEEAMYKLGQLYAQKLNEPDSAIKVYEKLLDRFEDSEYSLRTRYALYKMYAEMGNPLSQAQASYIINNHPKTVYAYLIQGKDPNELQEEEKEYLYAYDGLFSAYSNKEYETSLGFSEFLLTVYKDRAELDLDKLHYIRGMSYGYTGLKDSLKEILTYVVNTFPESEVTPPAKKTLELMDKGFTATKKPGATASDSEDSVLADPKNPRYAGFSNTVKPTDKIFVLMYVDKTAISKSDATNKVNDFNAKYFKDKKLRAYTFLYKQTHLLPYISSFKKVEDAKNYIEQFLNDEISKEVLVGPDPEIYYISHSNFKIAYGKKRMSDYILYQKHILK